MQRYNLHTNTKQKFRFRKWSCKNWAIFHSLGREITIGHLSCPMSNQALLKSFLLTTYAILTKSDEQESEKKELFCEQELLSLNILSAFDTMKLDYSASPLNTTYYNTPKPYSFNFRKNCEAFFMQALP